MTQTATEGKRRRRRLRLHPCKRLDMSWADWLLAAAWAFKGAARLSSRRAAEAKAQAQAGADPLLCLTVRSAFDLYLQAQDWETGGEIVFAGLTVPDMPRIAQERGLVPVPLDIDPLTAEWSVEALKRSVGRQTRAVVLTHLFGAKVDIEPSLEIAHRAGAAVVEDGAQAYRGQGWFGHPEADISLFSFGPMKTATALGGAVARVRDPETRGRMAQIQSGYPIQPAGEYLRRVLICGLMLAGSNPTAYGVLSALAEAAGVDREAQLHRLTRNVPSGGLWARLRRQPCSSLLAVLARRLSQGEARFKRRRRLGRKLFEAAGKEAPIPTRHASDHAFWMIPLLVEDAPAAKRIFRAHGFDAVSNRLYPAPGARVDGAERIADAVYLPFDPRMSGREIERLGALVKRHFR